MAKLKKLNRLLGHRRLAQSPLWAGPDVSQEAFEGTWHALGSIFCDLDDLSAIGGGENRLTLPALVSARPLTAIARDLIDLIAVGRGTRNRLTWPPQTGWRRLYLLRVSRVDKPPDFWLKMGLSQCAMGASEVIHGYIYLDIHQYRLDFLGGMAPKNALRSNITERVKDVGTIEHFPQRPLTTRLCHTLQSTLKHYIPTSNTTNY